LSFRPGGAPPGYAVAYDSCLIKFRLTTKCNITQEHLESANLRRGESEVEIWNLEPDKHS